MNLTRLYQNTTSKFAQNITILLFLSFQLSGCVPPIIEHYTAFQDKSFSARGNNAGLFNGKATELMQNGYLLIGYIDFKHNIQICYENNSCTQISTNTLTQDELLKRSAQRGADQVQILFSSLELVPKTYSVCTGYTTTSYTDNKGKVHTMTTCISYASYNGHMESWNKRALLWRHEPTLSTADNNYLAVQKAFAIIDKHKSERDQSNTTNYDPTSMDQPIKENKDMFDDLYSSQLAVAINNENLVFLKEQLNTQQLYEWQNNYSLDLLMLAFVLDKPTVYRWLLNLPVKSHLPDNNGYTALEYAIAYATPADVKLILKNQPELLVRLQNKDNIYRSLSQAKYPEMLDYLLSLGFSVNGHVDDVSILSKAIMLDNEQMVHRLLENHAKIESRNSETLSPLVAAILRSNMRLTEYLLNHGADINSADELGNTPLHFAAARSSSDIIKLLIQRGAKLNAFNKKGFSPLYIAMLSARWDLAENLMDYDANFKIPSVEALIEVIRGLLYSSPPSTLEKFLNKTALLRDKNLIKFNSMILDSCAQHCTEEKMNVFFDYGVNVHYSYEEKSLFQTAYENKNIGALISIIRHGYRIPTDNHLNPIQTALIKGDLTLVKAYRIAQNHDEYISE